MLYIIVVTLACVVGAIVLLMGTFAWLAYLIVSDEVGEWQQRMDGLRDNE